MNDARLDDRSVPDGVDCLGQSFQSVTDHDAHIAGAAVLDLGEHRQPELGAFAALAGPQPEDVALACAGDPHGHVDGPVGDLPVADLDEDGVDEDHWIYRFQRPVAPFGHLADHLVGDPADGVFADGGAVDVGEVCRDLAGRQSFCRQRQYDLINTGQATLSFLDDLRVEAAVGVTGHLDLDGPDLGEHRLGPGAVSGIAAATARWVMLVITQVLGHLRVQRGLKHVLGQLIEQPVGADQFDSLFLRLRQQLLSQLPLIQFHRHRIECF